METRNIKKIFLFLLVLSLLISSLTCSMKKTKEEADFEYYVGNKNYYANLEKYGNIPENFPNKQQAEAMAKEATLVMNEALDIFKKGRCASYLTDDIDKRQDVFQSWFKKTEDYQRQIGSLLVKHPDIKGVAIRLELPERKTLKLKTIGKVLFYSLSKDSAYCLVFLCEDLYIASGWGLTSTNLIVINIPKFIEVPTYILPNRPPAEPNSIKKDFNEKKLIEEILQIGQGVYIEGKGSKGILICITKGFEHVGSGFWPTGMSVYFVHNFAFENGEDMPECPKDIYGKPIGTCLTFSLSANK